MTTVSQYQQPYRLVYALNRAAVPLEVPTQVTIENLFTAEDGTLMFCQSRVMNLGQPSAWPEAALENVLEKEVHISGRLPKLQPYHIYTMRNAQVHLNGRVELTITPETEMVLAE